jgi:hypothetical protein
MLLWLVVEVEFRRCFLPLPLSPLIHIYTNTYTYYTAVMVSSAKGRRLMVIVLVVIVDESSKERKISLFNRPASLHQL